MAQGSIVKKYFKKPKNGRKYSYHIVYYIGKKQKWKVVGPCKKEAQRVLAQKISEINNGIYREQKRISFKEFAQKWLNDYARPRVKPSTFRGYSCDINSRLIPAFGDYYLHMIDQEEIQRFISKHAANKNSKTVNNYLVLLKTMLKIAVEWGYLKENISLRVKKLKEERKEMDYLNPSEIQLLLQKCDEPLRTIVLTAVLTGMRRGELLGLQWGDIDWNSNMIYVRRSLHWRTWKYCDKDKKRWTFGSPKSRYSVRSIVMSPKLKETLEIYRMTSPISADDLVFCDKTGHPLDPDNFVKRRYHSALNYAGLRRVRFHDLRHSYCALLVSQVDNIKFIQSQLGHSSIQTTLDVYGHLLPNAHKGVGKKLDAQIFTDSPSQEPSVISTT